MNIVIDAQLSPSLAVWINQMYPNLHAQSVRALGLRDATDRQIFEHARTMEAVIISKDDDFSRLVDQLGTPPSIIWITCGNTSNAYMRELLSKHLLIALDLITSGEPLVEIGER